MPVVLACCVVLRVRELGGSPPAGLAKFPVAIAWGKHLFPFRTEQLSPTAPMVLDLQGPGRVGRRRSFTEEPPAEAALPRSGPGGGRAGAAGADAPPAGS